MMRGTACAIVVAFVVGCAGVVQQEASDSSPAPERTLTISAMQAVAGDVIYPGAVMLDGVWSFRNPRSYVYFPIEVEVGSIIDTFQVSANKRSPIATDMDAQLVSVGTNGTLTVLSFVEDFGDAPGSIVLANVAFSLVIRPDEAYAIRMVENLFGGPVGLSDTFTDAQITYH